MALIRTGAEIQAMIDLASASVDRLESELGDGYLRCLREHLPPPKFDSQGRAEFVTRFVTWRASVATNPVALNSGSTYDAAVRYLRENQEWRVKAAATIPPLAAGSTDPYPIKDDEVTNVTTEIRGFAYLALAGLGMWAIAKVFGK